MAIPQKLRDGSETLDLRLARLKLFDERSRKFTVRAATKGKKPRSFTWRCDAWLDQGQEGACVGFSLAHELVARPAVVKGINAKFAVEKIYWEAQRNDPWEGGSYPGAKPRYEGTAVLEGIKAVQKLGYIEEYRWAFGLQDLILAVGHLGPAVLGVPWYEGMFAPAPCQHIHVHGAVVGGHAILCNGVNVKKRTFTLHNSWGKSWGTQGEAQISWDEMDRLLHEEGEAVIPLKRKVRVA